MSAEAAVATLRRWKHEPVAFARENFKIEPDEWQKDTLSKLKPEGVSRICMKACAGPGKTAGLAWMGWWFLSCMGRPGEHPKGAAVATTFDNLKANLWPELAKWQERSPYLKSEFVYQKEQIFARQHPNTWFLQARGFSKTANAEEHGRALSGLHSEYVFALVDESGDIAPSVGRAAEQAMGNCRVGLTAQAGNPTSMDGMLYESCTTLRNKWDVITITGDPDDPKRSPRVDITWAREQIELYGRDNPWVMSYILGLFPPGGVNALLSLEEVEAALGKHLSEDKYSFAPKVLGIDVARFGGDRTVLFPRQGLAAFMPEVMRDARTEEIAGRAAILHEKYGFDGMMVDGTGGYGAGVVDALRLAKYKPHEVQFAGEASNPRYFNKRSEMWWEMAQWVKSGGALPRVPELAKELTTPMYFFQNGKIRLEEKDQIKKRLGKSPDLADGLALGFAVKLAPRGLNIKSKPTVSTIARPSNYSPFRR